MEGQQQETTNVSSISEVLANRTKAAPEPPPEPTPPSPAAPAAALEVPKEPLVPAVAAEAPPKSPETGLLKATQAERRKRQELEQQNQLLQQQLQAFQVQNYQPVYQEPAAQPDPVRQVESRLESRLLGMSEFYARQAHSDFQEKFDDFATAASSSPALYESVMSSDNPAEAAYQAGIQLQFQKKYGTDLVSQMKGIRTEVESDLRTKIRAEVEAEFAAKVAQKNNQPTNILQGRAAVGGDIDRAPLGFRDLLAARKKR